MRAAPDWIPKRYAGHVVCAAVRIAERKTGLEVSEITELIEIPKTTFYRILTDRNCNPLVAEGIIVRLERLIEAQAIGQD